MPAGLPTSGYMLNAAGEVVLRESIAPTHPSSPSSSVIMIPAGSTIYVDSETGEVIDSEDPPAPGGWWESLGISNLPLVGVALGAGGLVLIGTAMGGRR